MRVLTWVEAWLKTGVEPIRKTHRAEVKRETENEKRET